MNETAVHDRVISHDNLTLCKATYFEACWCPLNSSQPSLCPYLLRHAVSYSNASYFCVYHTIQQAIECLNASCILPRPDPVSHPYLFITVALLMMGVVGNGLSIVILLGRSLRHLSVYRNLAILCALNILYLSAVCIRHINTYHQDLRDASPELCRLHTFAIAFTGHLCSWQLVSTSIQRVRALLSLELHRAASWIHTLTILVIGILLPLFILDGQILFNYGLLHRRHLCERTFPDNNTIQFRRALYLPMNRSQLVTSIHFVQCPIQPVQNQTAAEQKCHACILWNVLDTFVYAIVPFAVVLTSSIIITVKICARRRSMASLGGICHTNRRIIRAQDNLSILLIVINCLFLVMTGPFNVYLIVQSSDRYFSSHPAATKGVQYVNEYLRTLQNSYHALSFVFYCVVGHKFRQSACSRARYFYRKLSHSDHAPSKVNGLPLIPVQRNGVGRDQE